MYSRKSAQRNKIVFQNNNLFILLQNFADSFDNGFCSSLFTETDRNGWKEKATDDEGYSALLYGICLGMFDPIGKDEEGVDPPPGRQTGMPGRLPAPLGRL